MCLILSAAVCSGRSVAAGSTTMPVTTRLPSGTDHARAARRRRHVIGHLIREDVEKRNGNGDETNRTGSRHVFAVEQRADLLHVLPHLAPAAGLRSRNAGWNVGTSFAPR